MKTQLYLRVPPCVPAPQVADFARQCEEAGFAGVGLIDSHMLAREVFVTMAGVAQATSRLRMATAVTNPVTRHASVVASAARAVEEVAPGRVEVWLGRGDTAAMTAGLPPASQLQIQEYVLTLRRLLAGEAVSFNGVTSRLRHAGGTPLPVYLAASGPGTLRLAGAVADGVLLRVGMHPRALAKARGYVEEGARRAGRDPAEVEMAVCALTIPEDDPRVARERARAQATQRLMHKHARPWLREAGIDVDSLELPPELRKVYPDVEHGMDKETVQRLCAFLPDDALGQICDTLGFIGTPQHCARRLQEVVAAGLERIYLMPESTYQLPHRELEAFRQVIIPALATSGR